MNTTYTQIYTIQIFTQFLGMMRDILYVVAEKDFLFCSTDVFLCKCYVKCI